jgi:hypothetical protein
MKDLRLPDLRLVALFMRGVQAPGLVPKKSPWRLHHLGPDAVRVDIVAQAPSSCACVKWTRLYQLRYMQPAARGKNLQGVPLMNASGMDFASWQVSSIELRLKTSRGTHSG